MMNDALIKVGLPVFKGWHGDFWIYWRNFGTDCLRKHFYGGLNPMQTTVNIRPVTKNDVPQLLDLMYQYIVDFYKCPRPSEDALTGIVNHLIETPWEGIQFVVENETNELVGFATLYFTFNTLEAKRLALLHDMFVLPRIRGQKIGEQLFQTCL